jgi:rfaE bifunctional protein kinase chain/domain
MLSDASLNRILDRVPDLTIGVLGDLFLDRYLEIDAALTEPSLETGLDAYQVVRVRASPGAAGTVINNLAALGVKQVVAISVLGDDGEGHELRQALARLPLVHTSSVLSLPGSDFRTPTYTKPLVHETGRPPRELNRLDIKNRMPLPPSAEQEILRSLDQWFVRLDALVVLDQVSEADCGVVTQRLRRHLAELGQANPKKFVLADSRQRIGLFQAVALKPNGDECLATVPEAEKQSRDLAWAAWNLACRAKRPVFCTLGKEGIMLAQPNVHRQPPVHVPAYPFYGPIDIVGAGDSASAGIACAVAAGATLTEAAAFGNLIASITIQQIGTTGTATPEQVRQRWQQVRPAST